MAQECFNADIFWELANHGQALCRPSREPTPELVPIVVPGPGQGDAGQSAYALAVANGFEGTVQDWLLSLAGERRREVWIPVVASTNYQKASNSGLASTPIFGTLSVDIGGPQRIGDGVRNQDCYFSSDNGATAKGLSAITSGDKLYWNAGIAGFALDTDDFIVITYSIAS